MLAPTDTDEFRNRVRRAVEQGDATLLIELAKAPEAARLPASTLALLADQLRPPVISDKGLEMQLLQRTHQERPDDFYINYALACSRPNQSEGSSLILLENGETQSQRNKLFLGDDAISYARVAVALRPNNAWARAALARALGEAGRLDDAIAAYRAAIRLKPDMLGAYGNLGNLLAQQGKFHEAIAIYRSLIERQPDDVLVYCNLGAFCTIRRNSTKRSPPTVRRSNSTRIMPSRTTNLGNVLRDQRKLDEAVAAHRKAIELDPSDAMHYYNLGLVLQG